MNPLFSKIFTSVFILKTNRIYTNKIMKTKKEKKNSKKYKKRKTDIARGDREDASSQDKSRDND